MILIRRPFSHHHLQQLHPNKKHCASPRCHASHNVILFRRQHSSDDDKAKAFPTSLHQDQNLQIDETNEHFFLSLDLPGVKKDDLQVQTLHDRLRIEAKRATSNSTSSRDFVFDALTTDFANLKADLTDGVLTIELPKKESPEPADINIVTGYPPEQNHSDKDLELNLDLPGVKASDVKAKITGRAIAVQAKRTRGRFVSAIDKTFPLDPSRYETSALSASLADGVLSIHAPMKEGATPTKVSVSTNSPHLPSSTTQESPEKEGKEENIDHNGTMVVDSVDKSSDAADEKSSKKDSENNDKEDVVVETVEEKEDDKEWQHVRE